MPAEVGAPHVAVPIHLEHGAGELVDEQPALREVRPKLGGPDDLGVTPAFHETLERPFERELLNRDAVVGRQRPIQVKADVADGLHAEGSIDEHPPWPRRLPVRRSVAEQRRSRAITHVSESGGNEVA